MRSATKALCRPCVLGQLVLWSDLKLACIESERGWTLPGPGWIKGPPCCQVSLTRSPYAPPKMRRKEQQKIQERHCPLAKGPDKSSPPRCQSHPTPTLHWIFLVTFDGPKKYSTKNFLMLGNGRVLDLSFGALPFLYGPDVIILCPITARINAHHNLYKIPALVVRSVGFWNFSWFFSQSDFDIFPGFFLNRIFIFFLVFLSMGFWHFSHSYFENFPSFNLNRMLRYFDYIAGCWYGHWPDWKWNGAYNGTIHPLNQNNTSV